MRISELVLSEAMEISNLKKYAVSHYPEAEDENEALLILFAHSLKHAEQDDKRQDAEIKRLDTEIEKIKKSIKTNPTDIKQSNQITQLQKDIGNM